MMRPERRSAGFTIIELLAVFAILGLIAVGVAQRPNAGLGRAKLLMACDRYADYDAQQRRLAQQTGHPIVVRMDRRRGIEAGAHRLHLPAGVSFRQLRLVRQLAPTDQGEVPISESGQSPTYAIVLQATTGQSAWLLFAGPTGQATRLDRDEAVEQIFARLSAGR